MGTPGSTRTKRSGGRHPGTPQGWTGGPYLVPLLRPLVQRGTVSTAGRKVEAGGRTTLSAPWTRRALQAGGRNPHCTEGRESRPGGGTASSQRAGRGAPLPWSAGGRTPLRRAALPPQLAGHDPARQTEYPCGRPQGSRTEDSTRKDICKNIIFFNAALWAVTVCCRVGPVPRPCSGVWLRPQPASPL